MATRVNVAWIRVAGAALLALSAQVPSASATEVPSAYDWAAGGEGVPPSLLFALALQESGLPWRGRLIPWPWTLNINGTPSRYANRWDACLALRRALSRVPNANADVGLGQINVHYYGERVREPCELLDPYRNLALTARILREQHRPGEDWSLAVGRYHRPAGGPAAARYQRSVEQRLIRLSQIPLTNPTTSASDP